MTERIPLVEKVLSENDRVAAEIRQHLREYRVPAINLVSSPGAGKTTLLEKTLERLGGELKMALIAGDVQTENDAARLIRAGGKSVHAIVTGGACHLDARMIASVLTRIDLSDLDLLLIENVGNLVCPSSYDLGEKHKVVIVSTAEGDDKPLKYPGMFRRSSLMIVSKIDLMGTSDFEIRNVRQNALSINPELRIVELSSRTGEGLGAWFDWLRNLARSEKGLNEPDAG